ncbi:MAG TPA: DNA-binding transcriptional regulator [Balneolaceae bacterium]|nr:DNA-binding transcriptional regulator [Balneolaceae bacterium]
MNRIDRLTAIIIFLQGRKFVPVETLAERYSISQRTVYRDLRALEEAGVPIGFETGKGYFIMRGYHLPPVMFDKNEAVSLLAAERLMQPWNNNELGKSFQSALEKIRSVLPPDDKEFFETMDHHVQNLYQVSGTQRTIDDDRIFSFLQQAIFKKKVVEIDYKRPYKEESTLRKVEPLGLLVMGRNWYLAGWCQLRQDYRMFRLDRFKHYKLTGEKIADAAQHTLKKFYEKQLHKERELKEITVIFTHEVARFVGDQKFWHGWAWEETVPDGVKMTFLTPSIEYTARWLLSYGTCIKVVKSEALTSALKRISRQLVEHFSDIE